MTFWKMEGKSDVELKSIRLKRKHEMAQYINDMPSGTDVVTIDRSDKQSLITHEIWHSSKYIDLNER